VPLLDMIWLCRHDVKVLKESFVSLIRVVATSCCPTREWMIKGGSVLQRSTIDVKWRKELSSLEVEVVGKVIKAWSCVGFGEALEAARE
jgi:phage host-nuclease inhibitor protein Gam